jgi:hypothetical protein
MVFVLMLMLVFFEIYILAEDCLDKVIPAAIGAAAEALESAFVRFEIESPEI